MKNLISLYSRLYQSVLWLAMHFLDFSEPEIVSGEDSLKNIYLVLKKHHIKSVLIVTGEKIAKLPIFNPLFEQLENNGIQYSFFHNVTSNPTIKNVEDGYKVFLENHNQVVIGVGGGSVLDCAKLIAARSVNPKRSVEQMKGNLKIRKKLPLFIAVPTTAGTGSETTACAVIVNEETKDKYSCNDPKLIPHYAILDPTLLKCLPPEFTSTTGMDALTHAIEAYIGHSNTKKTKKRAISAVKLVFKYLIPSYDNPTNLDYREKMQFAAYYAGVAFTRAYVGSVHAISHSLGGRYNVPHGLANSIILPKVLKAYGSSAYKKLSELAIQVGIDKGNKKDNANAFIEAIEEMNKRLNISNTFGNLIKDEDIPYLVEHAYKESVPLYPTPRILFKDELTHIYHELQQETK